MWEGGITPFLQLEPLKDGSEHSITHLTRRMPDKADTIPLPAPQVLIPSGFPSLGKLACSKWESMSWKQL